MILIKKSSSIFSLCNWIVYFSSRYIFKHKSEFRRISHYFSAYSVSQITGLNFGDLTFIEYALFVFVEIMIHLSEKDTFNKMG